MENNEVVSVRWFHSTICFVSTVSNNVLSISTQTSVQQRILFLRAHPRLKQKVINLLRTIGIDDFAYRCASSYESSVLHPYPNDQYTMVAD